MGTKCKFYVELLNQNLTEKCLLAPTIKGNGSSKICISKMVYWRQFNYIQLNPVQFELDCLEVFARARSLGFAILFKSFYFVYHKLDYFKVLPVSLGLDFYSI